MLWNLFAVAEAETTWEWEATHFECKRIERARANFFVCVLYEYVCCVCCARVCVSNKMNRSVLIQSEYV